MGAYLNVCLQNTDVPATKLDKCAFKCVMRLIKVHNNYRLIKKSPTFPDGHYGQRISNCADLVLAP